MTRLLDIPVRLDTSMPTDALDLLHPGGRVRLQLGRCWDCTLVPGRWPAVVQGGEVHHVCDGCWYMNWSRWMAPCLPRGSR